MLDNNLDGLIVEQEPKPNDGMFKFRVTERYLGIRSPGDDWHINYEVGVPAAAIKFEALDYGYAMMVVDQTPFEQMEKKARKIGVTEVLVYPRF